MVYNMVCTALPCAALCSRRRPVSAIFAVFTHSGGQMSVIRTLCRDATWPNHCSWSRPFHPTRSQLRATAAAQVMRLPKKRHRQTDRQKARLRGVRLAGRRALRARAASALRASAAGPLVLGAFGAQKVPVGRVCGAFGPTPGQGLVRAFGPNWWHVWAAKRYQLAGSVLRPH